MKRLLLLSVIMLAVAAAASAQATAKSAFTTAPATVLPAIDEDTRLDVIDYYESGVEHTATIYLDGSLTVKDMSDSVITLELNGCDQMVIAVLPGKPQTIMTITTLMAPAADSEISFYMTNWTPLRGESVLKSPRLDDWALKLSKADRQRLEGALPFIMYRAVYEPSTLTLTLTPDVADYVAIEDLEFVKSALRPSLTYRWNGKKFVR